jgi:trans-aconitate methyltransferase
MTHMSRADFEARYRADPDPWGYLSSGYERDKYAATLAACGAGPFTRGLELGASIGVFSAQLAPRCERLITIDGAPSAVAAARAALGDADVEVILGEIPSAIPDGPYDLVVASEILYYLSAAELHGTFTRLAQTVAPGARVVAVHWRPPGPERPFDARQVHERLAAEPWLTQVHSGHTDDYLLNVLEAR